MKQERSVQHAHEKASVPMTAASDFVVPEGTDELSRSTRRAWRDRLNSDSTRKMITGVLATLVGGSFWGFSGTSASFLFDTYHVDTLWLMSVRQILAGLLFMAVVVTRDRERLVKLWTTPADRRQLLLFTAFGLLFNQFCYLTAVRLTNAGTASPAEEFTFTIERDAVSDAAEGITAANMPMPSIGTVSYAQGEAGSATAAKEIAITLPTYTSVGIYTYIIKETGGDTAGVTYSP